ncbi:hypothetical protein BU16DRAFT_560154 [Lophium mytilinum]|uniref:Uncharacterized protein n=1 Tax=Lophium mytilinum TaxID=390894 RepID=A0A6A6QWN2_9PEZI|nr:hypothetical protein BU16DRAFT_560154 [Lophium mytilinum]
MNRSYRKYRCLVLVEDHTGRHVRSETGQIRAYTEPRPLHSKEYEDAVLRPVPPFTSKPTNCLEPAINSQTNHDAHASNGVLHERPTTTGITNRRTLPRTTTPGVTGFAEPTSNPPNNPRNVTPHDGLSLTSPANEELRDPFKNIDGEQTVEAIEYWAYWPRAFFPMLPYVNLSAEGQILYYIGASSTEDHDLHSSTPLVSTASVTEQGISTPSTTPELAPEPMSDAEFFQGLRDAVYGHSQY